jgi:SMC interacting uncharacterized protein involved in chromosome segregation
MRAAVSNFLRSALEIYLQTSRATGRTNALIDQLLDGDRVIVPNAREADRIHRLTRDRNLKIRVEVWSFDRMGPVADRMLKGRTYFEHTFIEQHYMDRLKMADQELEWLKAEANRHDRSDIERAVLEKELADFDLRSFELRKRAGFDD